MVLMVSGVSILKADGPKVTGFVDSTYNYNFNKPADRVNQLRSFDAKTNNFALNSAQVQVVGTAGDAGYVVKVVGGSDAEVLKSTGSSTVQDVLFQEAFLTYVCPMTKINLKMGKFATTEGIEVIESKDDPTISRGYLFGLAEPFTHVGFLATRPFGPIEIGFGLVNGWDNTSDNNKGKTALGKLGFNFGDPFTLTISGLHGAEQADEALNRNSIDAVLVTKIIPKVTLNIQGNYGDEKFVSPAPGVGHIVKKWSGVGVQPVISITDKFSLGSRIEYFSDPNGSRVSVPGGFVDSVDHLAFTNFTITPTYKVTDSATFRLEYRYDTANKKFFVDDKYKLKDSASSVSAQWIVTF